MREIVFGVIAISNRLLWSCHPQSQSGRSQCSKLAKVYTTYHMQMAQVGLKKNNGQIGLALIAVGSSVNSISHGVTISRNAITVPNADALLIGRMRI